LLLIASILSYWLARLTLRPIRDSYERQRRFLGDASHELRTPLSILQLELENELHNSTGTARENIVSKLEEVQRMGKLVGDLLTISRLDEDNLSPKEKELTLRINQLANLLVGIIDRLKPLALSHNVTLTFQNNSENNSVSSAISCTDDISDPSRKKAVSTASLLVTLEEDLFSHALTNLIQNAIIYNKQGGTVHVALNIEHKKVVIEVKDNGVGISKQDLANIFERFYRADKSRTRKQSIGGTGLGLSIAKSALLHMGGDLNMESELNVGTTARIELNTLHS
jgi:signal transduction histidine kinase